MKVVFLAAVASLLVFEVSATEAEKKELLEKSKTFMDNHYKDVIKELKHLKASGKTYSDEEIKTLTAMVSAQEFTKRIAESSELVKLLGKLQKEGELKDFKIYEQGSPEVKKEVGQVVKDLMKDGLAPRVVGAFIIGSTQILTDMVRMGMTRYGEMPDSHRAQFVPQG